MQPQILLAVDDEDRRLIYEAFVKKERAICHVVSSLRDVATQTVKQPYNAIFIDTPVVVRASRYEMSLAEDALRSIPNTRLNLTPKTRKIQMSVSWETKNNSHTPEEHLKYCCENPHKIVLPRDRIQLNLNVMLSRSSTMESAERTVCIDFSPGGCFLFCVNDEITLQSPVWISLLNLNDPSPILSSVCWKREWGLTNEVPGIGIRFDEMTKHQKEEILALCRRKQKK
jgi:PilZ domain